MEWWSNLRSDGGIEPCPFAVIAEAINCSLIGPATRSG